MIPPNIRDHSIIRGGAHPPEIPFRTRPPSLVVRKRMFSRQTCPFGGCWPPEGSSVKIIRVESFLLSCPLPRPLKLTFWNGERTILKRDAMILRVSSDTGLRGYAPGPAHEQAAREIRDTIAPFLVGKDPLRWKEFSFPGGLSATKTYRAVEIAVMDLVARHEGRPLSELAGGRVRNRIKLYGSGGMYQPPEKYAEEAAAVKAMGFPAYKYRPALGPEEDLRTVELMRQA